MEGEEGVRSTGVVTVFISGNETNCKYPDDDVVHSKGEVSRAASGW